MKILFTKRFDDTMISEKLGSHFSYDFVEVIKINLLKIQPFDLKDYSLIFSSVNGVKSFFNNGFRADENLLHRNSNKIYVVGLQTKKELRKHNFGAFKTHKNAKDLCEFIIKNSPKEKFLHFCGDLALNVLNNALPLQNISYRKVISYETQLLYPKISDSYDAICFFSPSGVRSFAEHNSFTNSKLFSMGETTSNEIKNFTEKPIFTSDKSILDDLLKMVKEQLK